MPKPRAWPAESAACRPDGLLNTSRGLHAEHPSAITGIAITPAAATVFHATEAAQSLLQSANGTGLPLELGQETNPASILFTQQQAAGAGLSQMGPRQQRWMASDMYGEFNRTWFAWVCRLQRLCKKHISTEDPRQFEPLR